MKRIPGKLKTYFIPHQENDFKPHFFATRSVGVLAVLMVAGFLATTLQYSAILNGNRMLASVVSRTLVDITNQDRSAHGKGTLTMNPVLVEAAQAKANDMAAKSYFAHTSPEGVAPWHWLKEAGYEFSYAGENLAINFSDSIEVSKAWMDSPSHRANILDEHFTEVGIATAEGVYEGQPTVFVVQFFGKPALVRGIAESGVVVTKATTPEDAPESTGTSPQSEVAGAAVETVVVDDMFVAVKNTAVADVSDADVAVASAESTAPESSWFARAAASPQTTLKYLYVILGALIVFALALDTFIEIRRRHPMHIVYALFLWILIIVLLYVAGAYVFPEVIVV